MDGCGHRRAAAGSGGRWPDRGGQRGKPGNTCCEEPGNSPGCLVRRHHAAPPVGAGRGGGYRVRWSGRLPGRASRRLRRRRRPGRPGRGGRSPHRVPAPQCEAGDSASPNVREPARPGSAGRALESCLSGTGSAAGLGRGRRLGSGRGLGHRGGDLPWRFLTRRACGLRGSRSAPPARNARRRARGARVCICGGAKRGGLGAVHWGVTGAVA